MDPVSEITMSGPWGPLLTALSLVMAGGGIWTFLAAKRTSRAADKKAATADWVALNTFWQTEMAKMDLRIHNLEVKAQSDEVYIERLENHIWNQLPPPPPMRNTPPGGAPITSQE